MPPFIRELVSLLSDKECAVARKLLIEKVGNGTFTLNDVLEVGSNLALHGQISSARRVFEQALHLAPLHVGPLLNLASLMSDVGDHSRARQICDAIAREAPRNVEARRSKLTVSEYDPSLADEQRLEGAKEWGDWAIARSGGDRPRPPLLPIAERKLRIGYVSADLCQHTVGLFLKDVLAAHDPERVDIFAYSATLADDWVTEAVKQKCTFCDIKKYGDAELAEMIRQDRIDLLVDLSGHTARSRLLAFAYRPTPVMVSWLGYFATTGLPYLDAVLLDEWHAPPGTEDQFVEPVVRLPAGRLCYVPVPWMPAVQPASVESKGFVTYGCFNNTAKLNGDVLYLWAAILHQVPNSRLVLKWNTFNDAEYCQRVRAVFVRHGIPAERIELRGHSPHPDMLRQYGDIDIALDPFPFTGGMTSCEALWMGVPVVTWPQSRVVSRQTYAFLAQIGLPELAAKDAQDYVRIAVELAADRPRLKELHETLRGRMQASPLCDVVGFTRSLEDTLIDLYGRIAQQNPATPAVSRLAEEEKNWRTAIQHDPKNVQALNNLAVVLQQLGRQAEAVPNLRQALALQPRVAEIHANLGNLLKDLGQLTEAEVAYRQAIALKPEMADLYSNLGVALQDLGRGQDAAECFRRTLELSPQDCDAYSNLLFNMNYLAHETQADCLKAAQGYGAIVAGKRARLYEAWPAPRTPKKLRIGFVSGDLFSHPVAYFLEGLLARLDRDRIEIHAYANTLKADDLTARIKPRCAAWHTIHGMSDEAVAAMIHEEGIHVLIDLSGHTAGNRLPVFAYKPAPVQVSWLGYLATTGVAEIDYVIGDPLATPEESDACFTETLWRLPQAYLCYLLPAPEIQAGPLPVSKNGYVTFGCFNNLSKLGDAVVALWARILTQLPQARLFLKCRQLADATLCALTRERFAQHGIAAERLVLAGLSTYADYLAAYNEVDIALDPFPYPGGATSVDSLRMGVPVLTLHGDCFLARNGAVIVKNAGLADWVAQDCEAYVAKAAHFAADTDGLSRLRASLRQQMADSPLCDTTRFAGEFEAALWAMWQRWEAEH